MASEQHNTPTSDLRSAAQEYKRDSEHRHKWANGTYCGYGRDEEHPRPADPVFVHGGNWYERKARAVSKTTGKAKTARKHDMLAASEEHTASEESSVSADEDNAGTTSPMPKEAVMYSFDNKRYPTSGSQILNTALAKAIERYEDKETTKLVRKEYEMIDSEGENVGLTPIKKTKGKAKERVVPDDDEEYEFV